MRITVALCSWLFLAASLAAQPPRGKAEASARTQALRDIGTAVELARWAEAHHSAVAMLVAARMLGDTASRPEAGAVAMTVGEAEPVTRAALLARARALAAGDRYLLAQIDAATGEQPKGVLGQLPISFRKVLSPRQTWSIPFRARGGEPLTISLIRDGNAYPVLELHDARGRLICRKASQAAESYCQITPSFDDAFEAKIVNTGPFLTTVVFASD